MICLLNHLHHVQQDFSFYLYLWKWYCSFNLRTIYWPFIVLKLIHKWEDKKCKSKYQDKNRLEIYDTKCWRNTDKGGPCWHFYIALMIKCSSSESYIMSGQKHLIQFSRRASIKRRRSRNKKCTWTEIPCMKYIIWTNYYL